MALSAVPNTEPQPWTLLSTKWLVDHPWLAAVEDTYAVSDGPPVQWVRFADEREGRPRPVVVSAICQRDDGRVLIARQWNPGPERIVHEFPGGAGNPDESPVEALRRELMEEVGLNPATFAPLGSFLTNVRRHGWRIQLFLATDLTEQWLTGDDNEEIAVEWRTPAEVDAAILEGRYDNATLLASWTLYRLRTARD